MGGSPKEVSHPEVRMMRTCQIPSSRDGERQSLRYLVGDKGFPLVVFLHTWSGSYEMEEPAWVELARQRRWSLVQPDYRGPNVRPEACGSDLAQQDILDAVQWGKSELSAAVDQVFLMGVSGGGHMAMLMAARYPKMWKAVSEWVGISSLRQWYFEHVRDGEPQSYAQNIISCVGGAPGTTSADVQLGLRSPLGQLAAAKDVAIDFNAGIHDGHTGSVPIHHTLDAFNEIAAAAGESGVTAREIERLGSRSGLAQAPASEQAEDPVYGRKLHFRRHAGRSRVTIFEGGHEGLPSAAFDWFDQHN